MNLQEVEPNRHEDVAKNQHLVPQTYMKAWSYNGNKSVWVLDKEKVSMGWVSRNIEKINCINHFHDIMGGDIYTTEDALNEIFGVLKDFDIATEHGKLQSFEEMNVYFDEFEQWVISDKDGKVLSRKEKNILKECILQSRYTFVETEWCRQYENDWKGFIEIVEHKVRIIKELGEGTASLNIEDMRLLMTYFLIYDSRCKRENSILNSVMQVLKDALPEITELLQPEERIHSFNATMYDEIVHGFRIKVYDDWLHGRDDVLKKYVDQYLEHLSFDFLLTDDTDPFITSDTPAFMFVNKWGYKEHILVATPTMLITTVLTDDNKKFMVTKASKEDVLDYNCTIADNADILISKQNNIDIGTLLRIKDLE